MCIQHGVVRGSLTVLLIIRFKYKVASIDWSLCLSLSSAVSDLMTYSLFRGSGPLSWLLITACFKQTPPQKKKNWEARPTERYREKKIEQQVKNFVKGVWTDGRATPTTFFTAARQARLLRRVAFTVTRLHAPKAGRPRGEPQTSNKVTLTHTFKPNHVPELKSAVNF